MTTLFITGTDTGVGKTWVSSALARQAYTQNQSVIYYKPVQTGTPSGMPPEDPDFISRSFQNKVPVYNRYCFEPPVAPAAADTQGIIDVTHIQADVTNYSQQCDVLLVEGAGGLMVPLTAATLMIDLIEQLNIPVVLVCHSRLGTMNHTLLSIEALQNRGIKLHSVVFNFYPSDLETADISVKTLFPTLKPYLPSHIPLFACEQTAAHGEAILKSIVEKCNSL